MNSGHHQGHHGEFITELQLQPNDVLMGRGAPISDNTGNIRFLSLVRERCEDYKQAATRKEKDEVARQIVNTIHGRNGLFLRKIDSPEEAANLRVPPDVAAWTTADEKTVLLKVKQALRDRAKNHQQQQGPQQAEGQQDDADLFGMDAMVAHGPSPPLAKRAKSEIAQQQHSTGPGGPDILLGNIHPVSVSGAVIRRFQGAPDTTIMQQLQQFPLQKNFSQQQQQHQQGHQLHPGIVHSQPSFEAQPPTPQLPPPQGQDSTTSMRRASFDSLYPVSNTNFHFAGGNLATADTTMNPAAFHHGATGLSSHQSTFAPQRLPHRPHAGQDWDTSAAAGLNVPLDTTNANIQLLEGGRLTVDFRAAAFPPDAIAEQLQKNKDDQKLAAKNNNNTDTSGEAALRIACDVCEMGQTPSGGGVKLDPIELCLLSVLISLGLPTWSSTQFRNGDICTANTTTTTPYPFTWTNVGNHLVQEVQMFLYRKKLMLFNNNDTANQSQRSAIAGFVSRLVSLSCAYSKNPTSLARMSVMLLEKLRLQGGSQFASNTAPAAAASLSTTTTASMMRFPGHDSFGRSTSMTSMTSGGESSGLAGRAIPAAMSGGGGGGTYHADSSHGTQQLQNFSFATFLSKELGQWATSLNVADDVGFPIPCSSMDLAARFPQFGQNDVFSAAAILDASGCLKVLRQVSLVTRLRLIFQNNSRDQMISILRTSPAPQWRTSSIEETALVDMSLLQGLLVNGFSGLLDLATSDDGLLGVLLRHTSITKIDVEKRAVQLTCVLHQHVHSRRINKITNDQTARIMEMMGL